MRRKPSTVKLPQVNLIPMLDVLMSVLTFFVILTMSFSGNVIPNLQAPQASGSYGQQPNPEKAANPLRIAVNQTGQVIYQDQVISFDRLKTLAQGYAAQHPQGQIIFKADRQLAYRQIAKVLGVLKDAGGDRVSLTIEH